jgi:hypothetical protein
MKKKEFVESLKGKTVKSLLEVLELGQTGEERIAPEFLSEIIEELYSRELTEKETQEFEKLISICVDENYTPPEEVNNEFPEKEIQQLTKEKVNTQKRTNNGLNVLKDKIVWAKAAFWSFLILLGIIIAFALINNEVDVNFSWSLVAKYPFILFSYLTIYILANHLKKNKKKSKIIWIVISSVVLLFFLSFHIVPSKLMIFPKDNLSFSNTFITKDDINDLLRRYNRATNIFEQQAIRQEPLMRKLMEKGIIYNISKKNEEEDWDYSDYEDDDYFE